MLDAAQELRRNERLREHARLNPWRDVFEFERVGEALLLSPELLQSNDQIITPETESYRASVIARLEDALQQVNIWKSRTNAMSHSIESTAALAQIILRDMQATVSSTELRLAYSSAILRAINGLADVLQQQRVNAASVAVLCQQLGIPSWLVGIRHESTHNQLPSMAVLRLSAKSLLHYFRQVYWDPLARAKLDHWNDANSLLQAYHKAALQNVFETEEPVTLPEDKPSVKSEPPDRKQEKFEETELKALLFPFQQSKLGTSFNRFAVLQSTSKKTQEKKKRPKRKPPVAKIQKKPRKAVKIIQLASGKSTCASCGQAFVKANVPLNILRHALLSYLIWKGPDFDEMIVGGVLFAEAYDQGVDDSFELLKQRYLPLIQSACRAWPGFLTTILVHLMDALLSMEAIDQESSSSSDDLVTKISLLEQWVRCLLSKDSLVQTFPILGSELKCYKSGDTIHCRSLRSLQLPLNSLCDRCEDDGLTDPSSSSYILAKLFQDMLGDERVRYFGAKCIPEKEVVMQESSQDKAVGHDGTKPILPAALSLEEMEELLFGDNCDTTRTPQLAESIENNSMLVESDKAAAAEEPYDARQTPLRKCWVRCSKWDVCAIGSLPGHPN
ncbi:hypothetical protein FisN_1Lh344 [Fistulifera solaris]|uniref:Ribosomal biogenesis protein LAS1L n=1 Tax=Fistulifera solaris TaxID=1519565 RepID=A0A1Z5K4U7_FISSO|nr:hypothetical protein FisN_1Lh344 [Fistulifera solaris]|eukprot:GAX20988.1 hypothetical protein FisN_1Lh344 [Fistulifera solaris]